MNLAAAAGLGLGLGAVTGMPIGVVNVAIVDAAAAGRRRFALGIGLGGALADAVHAALAVGGIGQLVTSRPELMRWLAFAAAALIAGYAVSAWRAPRREAAELRERTGARTGERTGARTGARIGSTARGVATGVALTLPNPGALAAWVAVAASLLPGAEIADALAFAAGVGAGSAAWFALLAHGVSRLPPDHRALRVIPRVALLALIAIATYGVVRAL